MRKVYKPKSLFSGKVIGQNIDDWYVAVPDKFKNYRLIVNYNGALMLIDNWKKEAVAFRAFHDKFKPNKNYTLGYFKFTPDITPEDK